MIEKKQEGGDKEESISLKDNKEVAKKKKLKQIALQKINLGTKPINISPSNFFDFFNNLNLGSHIKTKTKIISFIAIVIIVFIALLILKGKFHHQFSEENKNLGNNQNPPINLNEVSSYSSKGNNTIFSPSSSSNKTQNSSLI